MFKNVLNEDIFKHMLVKLDGKIPLCKEWKNWGGKGLSKIQIKLNENSADARIKSIQCLMKDTIFVST